MLKILTSLQSILLSHIFFHLRQVHLIANSSNPNNPPSNISDIDFASHAVANLGAPLHNMFTESYDDIEEENQHVSFSTDPLAATICKPQVYAPVQTRREENNVGIEWRGTPQSSPPSSVQDLDEIHSV